MPYPFLRGQPLKSYLPQLKPKTGTWSHQPSSFLRCFPCKMLRSLGTNSFLTRSQMSAPHLSNSSINLSTNLFGVGVADVGGGFLLTYRPESPKLACGRLRRLGRLWAAGAESFLRKTRSRKRSRAGTRACVFLATVRAFSDTHTPIFR